MSASQPSEKLFPDNVDKIDEGSTKDHDIRPSLKHLFSSPTDTRKILKENFYSALSVSLISLPFAISILLSLDDKIPAWDNGKLRAGTGIMTLGLGFLLSFLYSGSKTSFRTFTATQYAIMSDTISTVGIHCISGMSLAGFVFNLFMGLTKKGKMIIDFFPSHILESIRVCSCLYLLIPDAYALLGVPKAHFIKEVNIIKYAESLWEYREILQLKELIIAVFLSIGIFLIHKKKPNFPTFFIFGALAAIYGLLQDKVFNLTEKSPFGRLPLLKDQYHVQTELVELLPMFDIQAHLKSSLKISMNFKFWLNALTLQLITMIEATMTI